MDAEVVLVRHGETEWSRGGQTHGADRHPADRARPRAGARPSAPRSGAASFALVLTSPLAPRGRDLPPRRLRRPGADARRADGVGLRRLRGPDDARRSVRSVPAGRSGATASPDGETGDQVGARVDRVLDEARARPTATSCSSRTATCCASSPRAGSAWSRPEGASSPSTRPRSASSATSARPRSSASGTSRFNLDRERRKEHRGNDSSHTRELHRRRLDAESTGEEVRQIVSPVTGETLAEVPTRARRTSPAPPRLRGTHSRSGRRSRPGSARRSATRSPT